MKKRKFAMALLAITMAFSMAACGGSEKKDDQPQTQAETKQEEKTDEKSEPKADIKDAFDVDITDELKEKAKDFTVSLVTDVGGIDDRSFNQGTWEGVEKFAELTGATINYAQSKSDADYSPNLTTFSEDEKDLIIATGFLFEDSIEKVAKTYPDEKYLLIDCVAKDCPNVASAVFAENEGSFLVGVVAAEQAKKEGKNTVGFIGGGDFDTIHKFEAGYEAGAKAVDPKIDVKVEYVGGFDDSGKAQAIAKKMYDDGAVAIYHAAGAAGNGVFKEAKERRLAGQDVWVIGVDRNQYDEGIYDEKSGKSCTLTSMIKRVDVASFDVAMQALEDKFPGGETLLFNLKNTGVDIPAENPNMSEEETKKANEFKQQIIDGKIKVPEVPSRLEKK